MSRDGSSWADDVVRLSRELPPEVVDRILDQLEAEGETRRAWITETTRAEIAYVRRGQRFAFATAVLSITGSVVLIARDTGPSVIAGSVLGAATLLGLVDRFLAMRRMDAEDG